MDGRLSLRLITAAIVLFTFMSATAAGPSAYSCPSVCTCYVDEYGSRTANCSGVKFLSEHKYNKLFHEIETLNLLTDSDDEHTELWDDMFLSFIKLKLLNLSKCKINHLPKNVFKGLKKIYEINLSYNDIKHFDNSVFENIYTLYRLNLRGNPLQASYKPFISSGTLRELDLGYCSMTVLQNEFFHGVKKVSRLHLDGNHLQTIKEHVLPRGITHLNLASNRIVNVPISTISSLSQLRWLNLGANPINCTCSLLNLQDRLSGRGIIIEGDVRCAYPLDLQNISWSKINENELCNKETFRSRLHNRKPQSSKYIHSQKKDRYFENEKYYPLENFQGDDPGKSTNEFNDYDNLLSDEGYDESKEIKTDAVADNDNQEGTPDSNIAKNVEVKDDTEKDKLTPDTASESPAATENDNIQEEPEQHNVEEGEENTPKSDSEFEVINNGNADSKKFEKQIVSSDINNQENEPETEQSTKTTENTDNNGQQLSEEKNMKHEIDNVHEDETQMAVGDAGENDDEATQPPPTTEADLINADPEITGKSSLDNLDENLKREEEIIPVVESRQNEPAETETKDDNDKNENNDNADNENKDGDDQNLSLPANESQNENGKSEDQDPNKSRDTETQVFPKNESEYFNGNDNDLKEKPVDVINHEDLNTEQTNQIQKESEEKVSQNENHLSGGEQNVLTASDNKTEGQHTPGPEPTNDITEVEGSGDDSVDIPGGNISVPVISDDVKDITSETNESPSSETPVIINPDNYPVNIDENSYIDNESSRQIVDKESDSYQAMGPYIVVACIILLITVLVLVSMYKGLCKPNKNNRKEVADVEMSNGTELQDMKSLLPKTPINDEKHNNKYPNEVPSPETVNLIKEDKTDDTRETNESHDLNQNDSKTEPVLKNGKTPEGSPPPIEITKAKLTVLHESIPRTPIFVQKRSTTINNG